MKKSKTFLIGLIILWVIGFLVIWGVTLFKKSLPKKLDIVGMIKRDKQPLDSARGRQGTPRLRSGQASDKADIEGMEGQFPEDDKAPASEAIPVRGYRVMLTDFKDELPVMGIVKGALEIELKFEINGVVESINFREGDVIYEKDLIATLNKKDAQLKVEYSKSKLESAKTQHLAAKKKLDMHKNLYEIGGIIKAKLEEVELEVKSAESQARSVEVELKSAEAELEKTNLYAPREGVLGSRDAEVGEFITSHDKVATLYDTAEVFVELGIVEKDIDKIALGQEVNVTVDAHPGMIFKGTVDNVFPVIEGKSRTLTVRVRIKNPDALLLPGMFARALISVAEFKNAIVVPSMSLEKTDDGYKVFMLGENNSAISRIVQVSYVTTDYTVVSSGLYEGEVVITETPQELKDGMSLNVIEVQESNAGE